MLDCFNYGHVVCSAALIYLFKSENLILTCVHTNMARNINL